MKSISSVNTKVIFIIILVLIWVISSLTYIVFSQQKFSQVFFISKSTYISNNSIPQSGKEVRLIFTAPENYLGIIVLPFDIKTQNPNGSFIFKLREFGTEEWYYSVKIDIKQFIELPAYPFGFPPINNSKDKTYELLLTLSNKKGGVILKLDQVYPVFKTFYQFPKSQIFSNNVAFLQFILKKGYYSLSQNNLKLVVFLLGIPLFVFILNTLVRKIIKSHSKLVYTLVLLIFILTMFLSALYTHPLSDIVVLVIGIAWFLYALEINIKSTITLHISLILLFTNVIFSFYSKSNLVENISIWSFILLTIGIVQSTIENY